ncbi:hypothetical protein NB38_01515 [Listeria monocytogenes]|uniref:hypothetical protein n=1 Tax=Listeria seeligeri TaxID=1640 RepID=UPI0010B916F5|nr:hypothetical protein [Listeria seeligeri]EAC5586486.1 hypothetical protein [Listeria monocytogenes]EAC9569954.1 hypothetical protein [Listeria monocytogenes]MBF2604541.1 hypothetical protein [Listeria seeligeri]
MKKRLLNSIGYGCFVLWMFLLFILFFMSLWMPDIIINANGLNSDYLQLINSHVLSSNEFSLKISILVVSGWILSLLSIFYIWGDNKGLVSMKKILMMLVPIVYYLLEALLFFYISKPIVDGMIFLIMLIILVGIVFLIRE